MNEDELSEEEGYLLRAKLHFRCGLRRLEENKLSEGIATIYDSLIIGMRWFVLKEMKTRHFILFNKEDLYKDVNLVSMLQKENILSTKDIDFSKFLITMELGLDRDLTKEDIVVDDIKNQFMTIMTKLGVWPFELTDLPPENPERI